MKNISTEDYVKAIYKIEAKAKKATTTALASELEVANASITDMVKKLSEKGLLRYERYQGVELTAKGRKMALSILRRHRLWEMFLVEHLGFSWDKVHDEAERLEHVTSEELERHLDKALGFPAIDPHGDPIPDKNGIVASSPDASLNRCTVGDVVRVVRVSDESSALLQHASKIGLGLNRKFAIKEKNEFDGSMMVKVGAKVQLVTREVAEAIFVQHI